MCAKGGKQVYVQRLAHINQGSLLQTILTVGNKWGGFFERKNFLAIYAFSVPTLLLLLLLLNIWK